MKKIIGLCLIVVSLGCGSSNQLSLQEVTNIPAGDGAGTALTGVFTVIKEITSNRCTVAALETPADNSKTPIEVEVTQNDGVIDFKDVDAHLYGGISFKNIFEAGGADLIDRGDAHNNILRLVNISGSFTDADTFTAKGSENLSGKIETQNVDCNLTFKLTGVRKP